ncbi:MAG: DUF6575 domain-containing protein [Tepidiformaceae bacterium]
MTILPQATILGELQVLDVFEQFDGPRLFSCRNNSDVRYLAVWVDEGEVETWLYVPTSELRLAELASGRLDLRTAFAAPEDNFVYLVEVSDEYDSATPILAANVRPEYLPLSDVRLRELPITSTEYTRFPDFARHAIQSNRETVGLRLGFSDPRRIEGPARIVGHVLSTFQETIDAIGQVLVGRPTARGTVPEALRTRTQMSVVSTYSGSFGLELAVDELPDLFGDSLARDSLRTFSDLLDAGAERVQVREVLAPLKVRSAVRYRQFLRSVADAGVSLQFDWASPTRDYRTVKMTSGEAGVAARVISEFESVPPEEYRVEGILTMGDVHSQRFTLTSHADGQRFSGRVLGTAAEQLGRATLNDQYSALIREVRSTTTTTDEESVKYELLELDALDADLGLTDASGTPETVRLGDV